MTRLELLKLAISRARTNGFELRRWYTTRLGLPWISAEAALTLLDGQRRYYALIFSHEFAQAFWKAGSEISFEVPATTFQRPMPDGTLRTIQRKGYIRRSLRPDVWRYHLGGMALAEDPLRYLRKYMHIEEDLDAETQPLASKTPPQESGTDRRRGKQPVLAPEVLVSSGPPPGKQPRPLPFEKPAFLRRPYRGSLPT